MADTQDETQTPAFSAGDVMQSLMPQPVQAGPAQGANMTPFTDSDVVPQAPDAGDAFADLNTARTQAANRYGPEQTQTTATWGALAKIRTGLEDPGTPDGRLNTIIGMNHDVIEAGQEKMLRDQIAQQAKANQVQTLQNLQSKVLSFTDPAVAGTDLSTLIHMGIDTQNAPLDGDELEMQGVAHLQTMGARDPDQAAVLQNFAQQGDVLDRVRDNVIKMQLYNREVDALATAKAQQGWGRDALDFVNSFIPLNYFFAHRGNVDNAPGAGLAHLPSTVQNREIGSLWNMPLDEFRKQLPDVMMNFTKLYGGTGQNLGQALDVAKQYSIPSGINGLDALTHNVIAGIDVGSVLPLQRMLSVPSKVARVLGNRAASADIAAAGISAEMHGSESAVKDLQQPYHSIEESLPSSLVPDTKSFLRPDVGVVGDIADRLDSIKTASDAARAQIIKQDRLSPEQLSEAVGKAVEEAKLQFRDDPIADMKAEPTIRGESVPQTDMDNVHAITSSGEVTPYRISAGGIAAEHAADISRLEAEGAANADRLNRPGFQIAEDATDRQVKDAQIYLDNNEGTNVMPSGVTRATAKPRVSIDATGKVTEVNPELGGIRGDIATSKDQATGLYSLNFYLGKRYQSGGFITREGAEAAATRRGFGLQDVGIHQNSDGQWFVKVKQVVTETGISTPSLKLADFPDLGLFPRMSAAIKSADNIMPEMFNRARITQTMGKQKFMNAVVGPHIKQIKAVGPKGLNAISKVLKVGERDQKWFTQNEFEVQFQRAAGRAPTTKETMAYYSAKELSDLNYHIFNDNIYTEKARRGIVTVSAKNDATGFDTGRMNGRVLDSGADLSKRRVYDVDEGNTYQGDFKGEVKAKLESGNYRLIDLEQAHTRPGEDPVKTLLVHNASSTVGPLEREQLGYVAGGSRENRFKWFVKQAREGTFGDGQSYWTQPVTHIAAKTGKQAREWAESMENARRAFFSTSLSEAEKRRIIELSPAESYDKFAAMVDQGSIDKVHPFEALYDRQTPTAMNHMGEDAIKWMDPDQSPEEAYSISKGRMYYSKKGDRLVDPNGEYAEIMDPFTTLHKAVNNAAQTFAFGDYNKKVIDEWARVASSYIDRKSVGNNWGSYNVFFNGKLSPDFFRSSPQEANQLEFARATHKRLLGTQTPEQSMQYNAARRLAAFVEGKGKIGDDLSNMILDRMNANPVTAVRGMVFDAKLGFFDPGQLIVQTQTGLAAMAVDPINGARTAGMLLPMSHMLVNRSENLLDYYAKNLKAVHGLDTADFKDMMHSLRNSGWLNVGGDMIQLDQYTNTIGGSAMSRGFNQLREAGRIPFNMSEKFNRLVAYNMSWQKIRQDFPKMASSTLEFQNRVNKYADDLSMNMTSSSAAFWQKGVLSIPTQFLAYQARVLENILPATFGGSTRFSGAQKLRLAAGQLFLYGAAGVPLGPEIMGWASKQYQQATGEQLTPETWRTLSKGFWDTALFNISDGKLDTDFASRAGQGSSWSQFFQKLTNGDLNSVLEVAGGPIGAVTGKMVNAITDMTTYMQAEQFGSLNAQDFTMIASDLTQQLSSLNRAEKAYWLWKSGTIKDPKSGEVVVGANQQAAIASALGIPLRQETERWDVIKDMNNRDDTVKHYAQMIAEVRRNAFQAMVDQDDVKRQHYENLASGLLMIHKDDPMLMREIATATNKELNYNDAEWDSLVMKLYNRTGTTPNGGQ